MSRWIAMTLGELISTGGGSIKTGPFGTVLKANEYSQQGVPIISVGEVGYGAIRVKDSTPRASISVTERLSEYLLRAGDIVFGRKGAVDRSAWVKVEEDGWFLGSDGIRLRLPGTVDSRFVSYQLRTSVSREWLLQHAAGTTMASLNQRILERIPLLLPEIDDQRAIAEVLGALDDKIAMNTTLSIASDRLARANFDALMVSEADVVDVRSVLTLEYGKPLPASRRRSGSVQVFGSGGVVGAHNQALIDGPGVVVGRKGTAGAVHWVDGQFYPIDTTFYVKPSSVEIPLSFCYFLLRTLGLTELNSDSAVPGLNRNEVHVLPVRLPDALKLKIFSDSTSALFDCIAQLRRETTILARCRDALLPELMSGRLRVKDVEEKVGEVL